MQFLQTFFLALAIVSIKASPFPVDEFAFVLESDDNVISFLNDELSLHRLPNTTKPINYNVLIAPDFSLAPNSFPYSGSVSINIVATQPDVNQIYLSATDLNILTVAMTYNGITVPVTWSLDTTYNFLIIEIVTGSMVYSENEDLMYNVTINFEAQMRNDMYGIYRSWYLNNNEIRWMATTQFQATSARAAFPCYDEPAYKATFDFTIRRPLAYTSWFNMRRASNSTVLVGTVDDVYYTTPIMSTYLLALIVAEYESLVVANAQNEVVYEVISRPEAIQSGQGQYAFEVGQELLAMMDAHTGISFASMADNIKMTQASIPDFSAGAMENWGLLTYREAYLLYDEQHTNGYFKQLIAYILSHEIAHMWFGNLVTCEWWDVLWLNEGFARYYQYFLTHWVEDYMGLDTRFITEQVHTSLLSDSVETAHPLSDPSVDDPSSVSAHFSTITYNKGAAIIRMTEHLLGFDVHRQGLENYLRTKSYSTARPIDLFQALQDIATETGAISSYGSSFNIIDYYNSWTEQAGHPILNVNVNHATGDMTITQRRFSLSGGYSNIPSTYIIPITFATASNPDFINTKPTHIISSVAHIINKGSIGQEWVIFNKQQIGFYRVNYDDYTWGLITRALRGSDRSLIHEYNRAQIVNDVFIFARAGLMTYTRAFNILSFLENETEYAPWVAAMTGFSWLRNQLAGSNELTNLNNMIVQWATTVMNQIGYTPIAGETFMQSYLRYQLAPVMCAVGVAACRTVATQQYAALTTQGVEVPVDSRFWVYCNALRDGTTADFDFLYNRFLNHNVYTEKIVILQTIGCTPHQASLSTLLNAIMQDNYIVRPQDYTTAYNAAVTGNEGNTQIVFQWIQNNINTVQNAFSNIATPLSYISARLRTEAEIIAFETWANNNAATLGTSLPTVLAGANNARNIIAWANEKSSDVNEYIVNGYQEMELITNPPDSDENIVTVTAPSVDPPTTPDLFSGATNVLSNAFLAMLAVFILFMYSVEL